MFCKRSSCKWWLRFSFWSINLSVLFLLLKLYAIQCFYHLTALIGFDEGYKLKSCCLNRFLNSDVSFTPLDPNTYYLCYREPFCKLQELFHNLCHTASNVVNHNRVEMYREVLNVCWRQDTLQQSKTNLRPKHLKRLLWVF
jgi:hypothetical protein